MKFKLTTEQQLIVNSALDPKIKLIQVDAVAGSSKSFTAVEVAKAINGKGRALAFNKAIIAENTKAFKGTDTEVKTTNSVAFKYVCTQSLVDNKTARTKFQQIVKTYIPNFKLNKQYTQEYLLHHTEEVLPPNLDSKIVTKIEDTFYDFINKKRWLNIHFNIYDIKEPLEKEVKKYIITLLNKYFNSKYIQLKTFLQKEKAEQHYELMKIYILKMINKEIGVPFTFNLKYYHILLQTKTIKEPTLDLLVLDEVSDSSEVILETFKLIPAHTKIMTGDANQSITSYINSVNGFDYFKNKGVLLHLTKSFRCSVAIAKQIEVFGQQHFSSDFKFEGFDKPLPTIHTTGYLSRTNAGLIKTMMDLHSHNIEYKLVRSVKDIFGLIKTLCYLSPKRDVFGEQFSYLNHDIKTYNSDRTLQQKSLLSYVSKQHSDNVELQSAISNIHKIGRDTILNTMEHALSIEKNKRKTANITLATVYGVKGASWTEVHINNDLNMVDTITIPKEERTLEEHELLRLVYVAYSRCTHLLYNAHHLKEI